MRDDILDAYPAIDPDRVVVIHNGVDTDEFTPDPGTDALARLGIDPDRPYVTFVGRITRQKGIDLAARRRRALRPRRPARAAAQRPRHPRGRRGDAGPGGRRWPSGATACCGWSRCCPDRS